MLDTGQVSLRSAARAETLGLVLRSVASFAIWTIAFITILGELGINLGPLIAGAGLAGVAIGFGAQSLVKDFLSGIFILVEDQYGVGDIVDVGEAIGHGRGGVPAHHPPARRRTARCGTCPTGRSCASATRARSGPRALLDLAVAHDTDVATRRARDQASRRRACGEDPVWTGQILEEPEVWGVERIGPDGRRPSASW